MEASFNIIDALPEYVELVLLIVYDAIELLQFSGLFINALLGLSNLTYWIKNPELYRGAIIRTVLFLLIDIPITEIFQNRNKKKDNDYGSYYLLIWSPSLQIRLLL